MKNRLLATLERVIAELREAVDAIVRDDYDEAAERFGVARDRLNEKAEELSPDEAKDRRDSPEERRGGPDKNGG